MSSIIGVGITIIILWKILDFLFGKKTVEVKTPKEVTTLYYNKGKSDAISTNKEKASYEISELLRKVENSDPIVLEMFPQEYIEKKEYWNGYIEGLKELKNRREL